MRKPQKPPSATRSLASRQLVGKGYQPPPPPQPQTPYVYQVNPSATAWAGAGMAGGSIFQTIQMASAVTAASPQQAAQGGASLWTAVPVIAALAQSSQAGASMAYARAAGQNYYSELHYGTYGSIAGTIAGGIIGFGIGGPSGATYGAGIGAAVLGGAGQAYSSSVQGQWDAQTNARMTQIATGISPLTLNTWSGNTINRSTGWFDFGRRDTGIPDPNREGKFVSSADYISALGNFAPGLIGGMDAGQLSGLTKSVLARVGGGDPTNATGRALAPFISDPYLAGDYNLAARGRGTLSNGDLMAGILGMGPGATGAAVASMPNALAPGGAMERFQTQYRQHRNVQMGLSGVSAVADVAGIGVQTALLSGNRDIEAGAYERDIDAQSSLIRGYDKAIGFYKANRGNDPYTLGMLQNLYKGRAAAVFRKTLLNVGEGTMGPSGDWIAQTSELQTQGAIQEMDPFFPFRSPANRRGIIAQDTTRLGEIEEQISNAPAGIRSKVAGDLSAEKSQRTIERAQQMNALRSGMMGQMYNLSGGFLTGAATLGLQAESLAAMQAAVPGSPRGLGGTGADGPTGTAILNELKSISQLLRSQGNAVGAGSSTGNPFSLAPKRANGLVTP